MTDSRHPSNLHNDLARAVLDIAWDDGRMQRLDHSLLRSSCRCAHCRAAPGETRENVRLLELRPVGTYGVQLVFDDGHERGIFPWPYLRELGKGDVG